MKLNCIFWKYLDLVVGIRSKGKVRVYFMYFL